MPAASSSPTPARAPTWPGAASKLSPAWTRPRTSPLRLNTPRRPPADATGYLNLGGGKDWRANCLNVDLDTTFRPDAVLDIARPDALGAPLESARFGAFSLHDNQFEAIFANDVLEHIPDLKTAMENCLRLIKPGGSFHIQVPYELSLGAWQDPTHVRAFNENSWLYYTDWYWYLGWSEARFDRLGTEFSSPPSATNCMPPARRSPKSCAHRARSTPCASSCANATCRNPRSSAPPTPCNVRGTI